MRYFFVLGRNPLLSEAEILSYLQREGINWLGHKMRLNSLVIDVDRELDLKGMINELGGAVAAGKVMFSGEVDDILNKIANESIYFGRENKMIYSVMNYADDEAFSSALDAMKKNFSNERLKARYKGVSGTIKLQSGKIVHGSPEKILLRDMNYFVFEDENQGFRSCNKIDKSNEKKKEVSFGFLEESYDSSDAEKRDMEKPYRREELAISPRLARILVNLSQVKKNETLVDPFCGIGVILGEALLREINVIGVDIDKNAVESAKKNIEWLRKNYKVENRAIIINKDSEIVRIDKADGIATEPSLGELMTKIPSLDKAKQITSEFEKLVIDVLNNVKNGLEKERKIVFTAPLIKTQQGRRGCDVEKICAKTGLRTYEIKNSCIKFPLHEYRDEQIVGRDIFVLIA